MLRQGCFKILLLLIIGCLISCTGGSLWTGASLVYDRHDVYKKLDDYHLYLQINNVLAVNQVFKRPNCVLDIAVFNGDILIAGHLSNSELLDELQQRLNTIKGYRRLFNEVRVNDVPSNALEDGWITTKIRSQIFADSSIDPNAFKIITSDGVVYLMGDVRPEEAMKVVDISRHTVGVRHVVKVLKYLVYK